VQVPVSGASMLPTLPEEGFVDFQRYVQDSRFQSFIPQQIKRGDIVVFENTKTADELKKQEKEESGFVKRVVGIAGDTVVIKDGFVYVNSKPKGNIYFKSRSTLWCEYSRLSRQQYQKETNGTRR
jgi:signal peptidase I